MGRYKLPDKVKDVRGTKRKDREQNESVISGNVITTLTEVNVPSHLSAEAKKVYKAVVVQLFALKILQPADSSALAIFANAIVTINKMQKALDKEGYLVDVYDKDGNVIGRQVNPMQKVLKDAISTANTIGSQFGWSPAARIRLISMVDKEAPKNDFTDYLK